jgi:hypothetical protein
MTASVSPCFTSPQTESKMVLVGVLIETSRQDRSRGLRSSNIE